MTAAQELHLDHDAYFARLEASPTKLEFFRGEVFDMAGGGPRHSLLASGLSAVLTAKLAGRDCRPMTSDTAVWLQSDDAFVFPDISVVCGRFEEWPGRRGVLMNPRMVVEVLSPSTRERDLSTKLLAYRATPSIEWILFIEPEGSYAELHHREGPHLWRVEICQSDEQVLAFLGISLTLGEAYAALREYDRLHPAPPPG